MRGLWRTAAAGALSLALLSVGSTAGQAADKVVVIVKATTSEFWQTVLMGARQASAAIGVDMEELGPPAETDLDKQVAIFEQAISQKPSAIVIAPLNIDALVAPIEQATAAGIPVIVIDSGVNTTKYASYLTTDNVEGGRKGARQLASCIEARTGKAAGEVGILTALAGNESQMSRDAGFTEVITAEFPDIKIVDNRIANNDVAKAMSQTTDMRTAFPNLVGIFADNAQVGTGAGAALDEQGLAEEVCLVAFDADAEELNLLKKGVINGLILQDPFMMGYGGVLSAVVAAKGGRLAPRVDTGVHVITLENMADPYFAGLLDPNTRTVTPYIGP
jgi:ribose transport system substrate-binding protein